MNAAIVQPTQITTLQSRTARLREALNGFGDFVAAARRADPLPVLQDLACDWMRAEACEILVPAGTGPLHGEDKTKLCGPIMIGRHVVGRVEIRRSRPFDEDDRALFAALSQMIGVALDHASLQSQLDERASEARAYADTLDTLLTFGRDVVNGTNDPLRLARWVVAQVPAMVGGERASVLLLPVESADEPTLVIGNGHCTTPERAREVIDH
ncbi:MAG: diguanylate cyclase, partial [Chloroflexales bacterium]